MQINIIEQISNSCSCSHMEAQEYLDSEIRYLCELQELDDLREDDIETACLGLGLDLDCLEYLSTASQGHKKLMAMTYFQNIHSLADLKKEYRRLALEHHPDKGGDTAIMQQVNTEFGRHF